MSRRERYREATKEEIKAIARRQMAETGTGSISINALAREMDMTPSGFYRYFASRDELITSMIEDAWASLADALEAADAASAAQQYAQRMTRVLTAYRAWTLVNRVEFDLLFGNPIPNYQPPAEAENSQVRRRSIGVIFRILAQAHAAGALAPDVARLMPGSVPTVQFPEVEGSDVHLMPPLVAYLGIVGWAYLHGVLSLEVHHHTHGLVVDPDAFYQNEIRFLLSTFGLNAHPQAEGA